MHMHELPCLITVISNVNQLFMYNECGFLLHTFVVLYNGYLVHTLMSPGYLVHTYHGMYLHTHMMAIWYVHIII